MSSALDYKFLDTHSDICHCNQGIEDVSHFLFLCLSFATQRVTLAISVIEILQRNNLNHLSNQSELYLYGHSSINVIDNIKILLSTIKNIKDTQHFASHLFYAFFFSGTKHPREDNPNLYYWAEITGLHTQTFNI